MPMASGLMVKKKPEICTSAIDMVVDKVEAQIKKYREKLKKRKSDGGTKPLVMKMDILAGESF